MKKTYYMTRCDKCGQKVSPENSALLLDDLVEHIVNMSHNRHLYPTSSCEGSPSRVKMIADDLQWREAYQQMKTMQFELIDLENGGKA
jgi:sulfur transfer complex TusBCD TusB component (DsrH family)